jgi:very-short-patch-repair endonuclease
MARKPLTKEDRNRQENQAHNLLIEVFGIEPEKEHRFHPTRKWRFDFAYPAIKTAIEVEGGIWVGGRHIHPAGFEADCEKYNEATRLGWKVFRFPPKFLTLPTFTSIFSELVTQLRQIEE